MKIICRICKTQQGQFFTLDSELHLEDATITITTIEVLNTHFNLNADTTDELPQTVCLECFNYIKSIYEFILIAHKSDKEFRELSVDVSNESQISPDGIKSATSSTTVENLTDDDRRNLKEENGLHCINSNEVNNVNGLYEEQDEYLEEVWDINPEDSNRNIDHNTNHANTYDLQSNKANELYSDECGDEDFEGKNQLQRNTKNHNKDPAAQDLEVTSITRSETVNFTCEFCYVTFNTRSSLKTHLHSHPNERPYQCSICGETFKQSSILKTHMSLHIGKTIQCHICHKRFSRPGHLNIHLRQHNNDEQSFQSDQSDSSHTQQNHVEELNTDTDLYMRFQCPECEGTFTRKSSLKTHLKQKHSQTVLLYCCNVCNIEFTEGSGLYHHIKSNHPENHNV